MNIEVILTPAELPMLAKRDLRETICIVFDVLRATSTFVTALHNGAKAIIPVCEISEALAIRQKQPDVLLGGERNGLRISAQGIDFDLGNSPREYTPEKVRGKTIVSTTTNGTRALRAGAGAKTILAASFLNLGATAKFLQAENFENVLLVCAGTGENRADEDILTAGMLCEMLIQCNETKEGSSRCGPCGRPPRTAQRSLRTTTTDAATRRLTQFSDSAEIARRAYARMKPDLAAAVCNSENGRRLLAIPELRDDVAFCLQHDTHPLIAKMEADGAIRCG